MLGFPGFNLRLRLPIAKKSREELPKKDLLFQVKGSDASDCVQFVKSSYTPQANI